MIQTHLLDVQFKFEDHFQSLGQEIRNRDALINQLQYRIQELENGHISPTNNPTAATSGNGSTGSSGDIAFVVSIDAHFIANSRCMNVSKKNFPVHNFSI